jgi:hypothetical protein
MPASCVNAAHAFNRPLRTRDEKKARMRGLLTYCFLYGHAAMKHRANFCFLDLVPLACAAAACAVEDAI